MMLSQGGVQSLKGRQLGGLVDRSQLVMRQAYSQSAYQQAFLLRQVCEEKGLRDPVEDVVRLLRADLSTRAKQAQNNAYAMNSLLGLVLSTQSESDRSWLLTQLPASTQLAMVRASVLKPQEKMALLHALFTQYQHNLISRVRMAFSVVSAVSLALLVTVGISRGGAIGGMLSLGFAQMGLVTLHFMASRVSRLLTAVYDVHHKQQLHDAGRAQDAEGKKSAAWQVEYEKNYQAELSAAKQKRFDLMVDVGSMSMMLFTVVLVPPIWVVGGSTVVVADFLGTKMQQWARIRFDMPLRQTTVLAIAGLLQSPKNLTFVLLQGARLLGRKVGRLVHKNDVHPASSDAMKKTVGEVVHTAVRSSEGEMLASVFDFTQSSRDMVAYFSQVRHYAMLQEVMGAWQSELRAQGALKNAQSSVKVGTQDLAVVLAKIKTGLPKEPDSLKSHIDKGALDLQARVDESSARIGALSGSTKKDSSQDASISATKQRGLDATSSSGIDTKVKK